MPAAKAQKSSIRKEFKLLLIGSGKVAESLLNHCAAINGLKLFVNSRNAARVEEFKARFKIGIINHLKTTRQEFDACIVAVSDDALPEISSQVKVKTRIILHTSGSVSQSVFQANYNNYGSFYPLQTFSEGRIIDWKQVPVIINASNKVTLNAINKMASLLGCQTQLLNDEQRSALHLAAVISCNFSNYLIGEAQDYLRAQSLDSSLLKPLLTETVNKALERGGTLSQTGPAVRNDKLVIKKHTAMLSEQKHLKKLYKQISKNISRKHAASKNNNE
jgi:predicted short-subunit dehydrogenase-like oxidoreductase (DUF2520 family)